MLDLIRRKQKTAVVKLVFWTIIAAFVGTIFLVWGKGRDSDGQPGSVAVTVNGSDIAYQDYQRAYSNLYQLYQNIYRDQFNPALERQLGLKEQAINQLIEQTLLIQEAKSQGMKVSKKELVDSIAEIPSFQENGAFSKNRYLEVLAYQRISVEEFEALQKQQLLAGKVQDQLQQGTAVSDQDIEAEYVNQNEKVNLAFLSLAPALYETRVKIDEEALKSYFEQNREAFRQPESIALSYLVFEPAKYRDQITLSEEELEKYHRRHLDQFDIQEQAKASHVLIKVPADASEETRTKKRELAQKVLDEARAGKDFAELARKYSDDTGSAAKGGELGYFNRGTMVGPFEQSAFNLKPGDISEIVETNFGLHIIKGEGYIEAGVKPLAEVLDQVKQGLREEKAQRLAFEKAMDAYNINRKAGDLAAAAKANELGLKETGLFTRGEPVEGLGAAPEITDLAFTLQQDELSRPIKHAGGVVLFAVKERRESRLPELQEVRVKVEEAYRQAKGKEFAGETAEKILAALKDGASLQELADKHKEKVEETDFFTRSYGAFIPRLGSSEEVSKVAFDLTAEAPVAPQVFEIDGRFVLVTLKERQQADLAQLDDTLKGQLRDSLLARKKDEAVSAKLDELRKNAEITIAPALISALEGNGRK